MHKSSASSSSSSRRLILVAIAAVSLISLLGLSIFIFHLSPFHFADRSSSGDRHDQRSDEDGDVAVDLRNERAQEEQQHIKQLEQNLAECQEEQQRRGSGGNTKNSAAPFCTFNDCSGHGNCEAGHHLDFGAGKCHCRDGFAGKDCIIPVVASEADADLLSLVTVVVAAPSLKASDDDHWKQHFPPSLEILSSGGVATINDMLAQVTRPLVLILGPDAKLDLVSAFRLNIAELVRQMLSTDVDVLGMMTIEHSSAAEMQFDSFCFDYFYHAWQLRHRRAPFGYERHENFVMYCERVSNSFMIRRSMLSPSRLRFAAALPKLPAHIQRALNHSFLGLQYQQQDSSSSSKNIWPLCDTISSAPTCHLFDTSLGTSLMFLDFFLRIRRFNDAIRRSYQLQFSSGSLSSSSSRIPGLVFVGACAESVVDIVSRDDFVERLTPQFAERHQIEVIFDAFGRRSSIVCTKSGGIYGHVKRGLFSPLCHRLARQRDFVWLSNVWTTGKSVVPPRHNSDHEGSSSSKGNSNSGFRVGVHHGNLFGALRIQEELFWETDGDFDLIALESSHGELMQRVQMLTDAANNYNKKKTKTSSNNKNNNAKRSQFEVVITYPEKPWYVALKRDNGRTDFQCNARSPLSKQTRGKPPQVHNVSISYQGRRVFINGFGSNPWQAVRSDSGHKYGPLYLAQQPWSGAHSYKKAGFSCAVEGHNACLPDCRSLHSVVVERGLCSDEEMRSSWFSRNPLLWFDKESPLFPQVQPPATASHETTSSFDEHELMELAHGETKRWVREHGWQYL